MRDADDFEEDTPYVSMTDMMIGILFIFLVMLMIFAIKLQETREESKRFADLSACVEKSLVENANLTNQVTERIRSIQANMKTRYEDIDIATARTSELLGDLAGRLSSSGLTPRIDARSGVLRLDENSIRFTKDSSVLGPQAEGNIEKVADAIAAAVVPYLACRRVGKGNCGKDAGSNLETILIEGHTDATGVADAGLRDRRNWQLSTERAVATYSALVQRQPVLKDFLNAKGEELLSISGYADTRPVEQGKFATYDANGKFVADDVRNRTAYDRNRRIDFRFIMNTTNRSDLAELIKRNAEIQRLVEELDRTGKANVNRCR